MGATTLDVAPKLPRALIARNDHLSRLMSRAFDRSSGSLSGSKSVAKRSRNGSIPGAVALVGSVTVVYWSASTPASSSRDRK